jgi:YD repeat-containing protein
LPLSSTHVITYAYDGLQRLADAAENLGTIYYYTYNASGQRTDVVPNGGGYPVGNVRFAVGYAFTLRGAFAVHAMILHCTFAVGDMILLY